MFDLNTALSWASHLTFLCLSFLIWNIEIIVNNIVNAQFMFIVDIIIITAHMH